MRNKRKILLPVLLCFLSVASSDKKCYSGCHGSVGTLYKYEEGTNYKYTVSGTTITTVPGSQGDVSKVSFNADVDISAQPQCGYILKLSNINVAGPDGKTNKLSELETHPVKFSFHDGHLESEVCAEEGETQKGLNIKRAIISLLQSATHKDAGVTSHYETDVFGTCPTDFEFYKSGNTLKIKKIRNLNQCAHRESLNFPTNSIPYSINSDFQSSPLLISTLKVEQEVQNGIVNSAVSEEKYQYQPHATVDTGVSVTVKTKLTFVSQAKGAAIAANVVKPKSIIFDAPHETTEYSSVDAIQTALDKAEKSTEPTIQPSAAQDFADLVDILTHSKKDDILAVFTGVKSKETAKQILLDGIAHAGTGNAVEVMAQLLQANELSKLQKNIWILSLGFIKHATKDSLKAVLPLLNDGPRQAYLGIGSLAGRYCSQHDCSNDAEFKQLLAKLAEPVIAGCKVDTIQKENKIIGSLKGLHNAHHLTNEVAEKVAKCAADKNVKTRIRVAALDTFQSDASKDKLKSTAIAILKNLAEDSEVRIKAYLALVECPCNKVADVVKNVLENEKVNQVGSFITSHLRNLKASTNPDKAAAKHYLSQININKKFPIDFRKFSSNQELSYSIDAVNLGAAGETNVIFSEKSYIPRSVSLNLTTQIFGHAFNLVELNARTENLDYVFEKYFGPKGYFPTHGPEDIYTTAYKSAESIQKKIIDKYHETVRPKREARHPRDIQQQTSQFAKQVDLGVDSHDSDLDFDLSLKLYGSEVGWYTYHGGAKQVTPDDIIDKVFKSVDQSFEKAKNLDVDYKNHFNFLDAEAVYPTGLGLPLKLNTKGSSAIRTQFDGKIDIPAIIKDPKNANFKFRIMPSAAIEISGQLSIDAVVVESGVKVLGTIHTSTGSDISVKFLEGHGIDVKVGVPLKKQDVVSFNSNIVTVTKEKGQPKSQVPVKFDTKRQEYNGCFDQLNTLVGLTFCGKVSYPFESQKLLSPAYGPTSLAVHIEKDDESLTSYHFKVDYSKTDKNQRTFEVLLDTPNSKTNRKLSFVVTGSSQPKFVTASITSPWKVITFDGRIIDTDKEHTISAKLLDDQTEYSARAGVTISGGGDHSEFSPFLEYKVPEFKAKETGLIGVKGGSKSKSNKGVAVSGKIKLDKQGDSYRKYTLEGVTVSTPNKDYKIDGTVGHDKNLLETDLKVAYDKESVAVKSNLKKDFSDTERKLKVYIETAFSEVPDFNFVLNWDYNGDKSSVGNVFSLVHGPDPKSEAHKISLNQYASYKYENTRSFDFNTKNSLSYPLVTLSGTLNGQATPKSLSYELEGTYEKYRLGSSLKGNINVNKPGDYNVNFKAQVLDNSVDFHAKREITSDIKSKFTNSLEVKPGGKYSLNAIVTHSFQKDNYHNHIRAEAKFPTDPKSVTLDAGVKKNKKEFSTNFDVTAGEKQLVNFNVEYLREKPSGKFVASLPPNFDSKGSFNCDGSKGVGSFVVEFPKQDRKIEGKAELTHNAGKYVGFADIGWDVTKNPQKKLRIETDTECSKTNVDTKNTLIYKGEHKTQFNYKAKRSSQPSEDSVTSEAELVLPSGRTFSAAYDGKCTHQTDDYDGAVDFKFVDYSAPGVFSHKFGFKLNAKNVNPSKHSFDGQATLTYNNAAGKDATVQVALKKILTGERYVIGASGSISGSISPYPVNVKLDSELSEQFIKCRLAEDNSLPFGTYTFVASAGDVSINSNGKVNQNQINNEVDIKLPADYTITSFKWTSTNNYIPNEKVKGNNVFNWNNDKFFKVIAEAAKEESGVSGKLEWESHLKSARTITGNAHYKPTPEGDKKVDAALNFAYEGKVADVNLKAEYEKKSESVQVLLNGNLPEQGKFDISVKNKVVNAGKGFQTDVSLNVNEKKITVTNHVVLDKENPLIDLVAEHPQGKSRAFFKVEKKGDKHYTGESKVKWVGGTLAVDGEVKFDSIEDFFIKVNADSPKLNIDKYHVEVSNKQTKQATKKITFSAKSADKIIFAGSTSYNYKEETLSKVIDGSGNIKIGEKSYPLTFKFVHLTLTEADGGEDGNQINANVKFGKNTLDVFGKLTPTTFLIKRTYTKETGEVAKAEISSRVKKDSISEYDYEFNLILDLSKIFNKDIEDLSLKITTKRNGFILDHNFELQRNPDSKIKYQIYVHENQAGAVLSLPKRVVAVEATYQIPKSKNKGIVKAEASLWLNKQKSPAEKTSLSLNADVNKIGDGGTFSGEVRATHPALGKDLVVSGHATILQQWNKLIDASLDLDVFAKKEQKIVIVYKSNRNKEKDGYSVKENLSVKGSNIDIEYEQSLLGTKSHFNYGGSISYVDANKVKREKKVLFEVTPSKIVSLVKIPEGTLLSLHSKIKHTQNHYSIDTDYELLDKKYKETIDIANNNNLKYSFIFDKGGNEKKLLLDFGVVIGQSADFSSSFDNKQLAFVQVALDEGNFLKSKYSYNTDNFKGFIETARSDYVDAIKKDSKVFHEAVDRLSKDIVHQVEEIQKSLPDFGPVVKAYTDQIEALRQEVVNEKSIQEAADYIKGTLSVILEQVVIVLEEIAKATESLLKLYNEAATKLSEALKKLAPKITEGYEKVSKVLVQLFEDSLKLSVEVFNVLLDKIKEHEDEIQVIVTATTEFISELGQLGVKTFVQLKGQVLEFVDLFVEQVKALPVFAMIKEKYEELKTYEIPEQAWQDYHEFIASVKDALPTPELSQFVGTLGSYAEKLLRHQKVSSDDLATLYKEFVAAVKSVLSFVQKHVPQEKLVKPSIVPIPTFTLWKIPSGAIRFSPFNLLRSSDLPSVSDIYYTFKPTLNPLDYIPPYKAQAYLVHSTEFFTFDNRHVTFKGNCLYILAQDFVDGNFSIAAKIDGGKVNSIIVTDNKDSVAINSDGTVNVNGAASEFPVNLEELKAWRRYPTSNVYSRAGVRVHCSTDLDYCSFHVSGFYFGKTRGLLGTINNEQYNDLALPNGKIASSQTEFGNAYKLGSCADVAAPTTAEQQDSYCTGYFTGESKFRSCFPYVNPQHYRHACNLVTAEASDKKAAACKIATAYYAACKNSGSFFVNVPSECIQCSVGGKTITEDKTVTVKVPQTKADIVLVVEQVEENDEVFKSLITPLVGQLSKDLKEYGITDVHFSLIGYGGPDMKWPQHYTTNGKLDFNGKSSIYFTKKAAPVKSEYDYIEKLKTFKHKFDVEVGNAQINIAFREAAEYPFRPDATKAVIGVLGGPCEKSGLPISLQHARMLLHFIFHKQTGVNFHLITNVKNLQYTDKDAKHSVSNVVGFSKDKVYHLSDTKKSANTESPSSLSHDSDTCISFTEYADGSIFNSANFVSAKADGKKQFLHVVSNNLAQNLAEKKYTLECECTEKDGLPNTKCIVEDSGENELKKGVKG